MAALAAEYGDYSYLRKMGIDTSELEKKTRSSRSSSSGGGYTLDDLVGLDDEDNSGNTEGSSPGLIVLDPAPNNPLGPAFSQYRPLLETIYQSVINDDYSNAEQRLTAFWADARAAGVPDSHTEYFLNNYGSSF